MDGRRSAKMKVEPQCQEIHNTVDSSWKELDEIWHKIGHDPNSITKRKATVLKHTQEMFSDMVDEEKEKLALIETRLNDTFQEILQLLKDLTMDNSTAADTKSKSQGKTLLEREKIYEDLANDLRKRKAIRMEKYNKVNDKVIDLTTEMDEELFKIDFEGIPSDAQVAQLEQKLSHLQKEKIRRQNLVKKLKKTINLLFNCTERIPKNELERLISLDDFSSTNIKVLGVKFICEMEELETSLIQEVTENKNEGERMWQKIRELWSRLTIEEEIQNAFEKVHRSTQCQIEGTLELTYKPTVLRGLQSELQRLEEEKKRNMALFIGQVRDELTALWRNKCFINDTGLRFSNPNYAQLTDFTEEDFISDLYTEELLEKHEREADYWRKFVERNKKIIDGVTKREQMFAQYRELDQKSDDPTRLSNRGGALLKEEKERKMLEKAIPKLEKELKLLSTKFSEELDGGNGMTKFLVFGEEIPILIEGDWATFHKEKDIRKEMRKKEGTNAGKSMMTTQLGSRPGKRPGTPGGLTTPKRAKLPPSSTPTPGRTFTATPSASGVGTIKKPAAVGDNDNFARPSTRSTRQGNFATPRLPPSSIKKGTASKIPSAKGSTTNLAKEQVNPADIPEVVVSPANSYSEFTDHLLCQSTLNSSAVSAIQPRRLPLTNKLPTDADHIAEPPQKPERAKLALPPLPSVPMDDSFN